MCPANVGRAVFNDLIINLMISIQKLYALQPGCGVSNFQGSNFKASQAFFIFMFVALFVANGAYASHTLQLHQVSDISLPSPEPAHIEASNMQAWFFDLSENGRTTEVENLSTPPTGFLAQGLLDNGGANLEVRVTWDNVPVSTDLANVNVRNASGEVISSYLVQTNDTGVISIIETF